MILPEFKKGTVYFKDGNNVNSILNYDGLTQEFLFNNNGTILALGETVNVDSINIDNRIFINTGKKFYEKVRAGSGEYYINWTSKLIDVGKQGGYGGVSKTSATDSYTSTGHALDPLRFTQDTGYESDLGTDYYLKIDNKYKRFSSAKSLAKLLKKEDKELENFAKTEKIDFKDPDDVKKLLDFALK